MNIPDQVNIFNKILDVCLKSINNEERKEAEIKRNTFFDQTSNFLQIFQILIESQNISKSKKKYLLQLLKKKSNLITNLSKENSTLIYKICLQKIYEQKIPEDEKIMYRDCLKALFTPFAPSNPNIILELRNDLINELMKEVNSNFLSKNDVLSTLHCFYAICEPKKLFNPNEIFNNIFPKIDILQIKFIFPILNDFQSSKFNLKKLEGDDDLKRECIDNLKILELFMDLIKTFIQNFRISRLKNKIIEISSSENMISFLFNVVFFEIGNLTKNKNNTIFNPTLIPEINTKINNIKNFTLNTLLILFKLYNDKKKKKEKISYFFNTIINSLITNLNNLYTQKNFNLLILSKIGKNPLINLIETSTKFIYRATDNFIYHKNFFQNINNFLKNFIFLNLLTDPEKITNFKEEKEEINGLINDMISDNIGDNLIVINSKALKKICLKIDGSIYFCFNVSLEIIDFYLNEKKNENKKYLFLEKIKDTRFFKQTEVINKLDVSLLILTILYKQIKKRPEFLRDLENIIFLFCEKLMNVNDFISFRFLYLISCYVGFIFCDNNVYNKRGEVFFEKIFIFIKTNKNIDYSVLKILENFANNDDHKSFFFQNFFFRIFENILEEVQFSTNDTIFSLIMQFVIEKKKNIFDEPDLFEKIFSVLINKLNLENQKIEREKNSTVIIHCWNILLELSNSEKLCKKYYSRFYFYLQNFLNEILNENKSNDFTEDFLNVLINVMKKSEIVVPYYNALFSLIFKIQKENKGQIRIVLKLIIDIFYKFKNLLDEIKLIGFLKLSIEPFFNEELKKNVSSYVLKDFFILIHLTIQKFGNRIPLEYLNEYIKIYKENSILIENEYISKSFLKKNLDRIILSLFYIKPDFTFLKLEENIFFIIKSILNNYTSYETLYEKKLLICGLMNIFNFIYNSKKKNEKLILTITNFLFAFMKLNAISNICVHLRKRKDKGKKLKYFEKEYTNQEKEINGFLKQNYLDPNSQNEQNNFSDSNSSNSFNYNYNENQISLDEDSSLDNDEINEFYEKSPLFESDEYLILKKLFLMINENDPVFLSVLRDQLDGFVGKMVDDVCFRTRYFKFEGNFVVRVVKKFKRC